MCRQVISSIEIIIEKISNRLFLKCLWSSSVQNMHFGVSGCGFPLSCRGRTIREMTRDVFVFQVTDQMKWYWKMCCFGEHITTNRNSLDGGTNESQVTTVRLSFKSSTRLQQHVADLQRCDFFFRKSCINLQFSANTMLSAAEFLLLLDSWGCGVIYIPLRPVDFCINLIKTRVGVHSSLGPVFNVNMNHVVVRLILSDDSRSVSPDTSPPKFITSADLFFLLKCFFCLFLKT